MKFLDLSVMGSKSMPDIATATQPKAPGLLDWVGMSEIDVPLSIPTRNGGVAHAVAKAQAYVNLINPEAKGIHMSRLYLLLDEACSQTLTAAGLRDVLARFLESHEGLSDQAFVDFRFDFLARRPALKSEFSGWKAYPARVIATEDPDGFHFELKVEIPYSSTCPCSAALARQLIQKQFREDFGNGKQISADEVYGWLGTEQGIVATPHSQRSIAEIKVRLSDDTNSFPLEELIDVVEDGLKTPVQTAVKREDEQEFALLNGQNLMFCEDAARRIQSALNEQSSYQDFWVRVNHLESLHAHNAVAVVTKGIDGGYLPQP
ncbi:MAG: GTP cyclohydrolase I FolE2 [Ketobacter sp.]|jgi:GTP cyclohydrolase IB|nr:MULTISPECIES: GTP cyclohydrolase FolE2 [unclassified Ketobacter]MCK5790612.1 GTP cyclohydrolase I FolE2 [Ketobacter sp.]|tara:strand:- start:32096 stop:33052 length:957 start_codon:yes stop_codon:yes gene_type:complete